MIPGHAIIDHEYDVIEVEGSATAIDDALDWCNQNFGPSGERWFFHSRKFFFANNKDAMWFELRY